MNKKYCFKCLSIFIVLLMLISMVPIVGVMAETTQEIDTIGFAGGSGTITDPYLIENKYQLDNIRNELSAHYRLINDIKFLESDFFEGGDFYNEGEGWDPISLDWDSSFSGVFNGNGYTISNLYSNSDNWAVGLFGYNDGTIMNLVLKDGYIAPNSEPTSGEFVGGFVGQNNGLILNCHIKNTIVVDGGGITGENCGIITNCSSSGEIIGNGAIGGIAGCNANIIEKCCNLAVVMADTKYLCEVGGIVGSNSGDLRNCQNRGSIEVTSAYESCDDIFDYATVGGVAGRNDGYIIQCSNYGSLMLEATKTNAHCGGLVGFQWYGLVEDCYNCGEVKSLSNTTIGGIIGFIANMGSFARCYNVGEFVGHKAGAFCGGYIDYSDYTITDCYYLETGKESTEDEQAVVLSYEDMISKDSFKNFDFESVWAISDTDEYKYPTLINCGNKNIVSITTETLPGKTEYIANQELLDISDGTIKVIYDNGTEEIIGMFNTEIAGFDNSIVGEQEISVMYCGFTTSFTVNISEFTEPAEDIISAAIENIELVKQPNKTVYDVGEYLNPEGAVLKVTYCDGTIEEVTVGSFALAGCCCYLEHLDKEVYAWTSEMRATQTTDNFTIQLPGFGVGVNISIEDRIAQLVSIQSDGYDLYATITYSGGHQQKMKVLGIDIGLGDDGGDYTMVGGLLITDCGIYHGEIYENEAGEFYISISTGEGQKIISNTVDNPLWWKLNRRIDSVATAVAGQSFSADLYNGEINAENIDALLSVACSAAGVWYSDACVGENENGYVLNADSVKVAFYDVFGFMPDLSMSRYYDQEDNEITVMAYGFGGRGYKKPVTVTYEEDRIIVEVEWYVTNLSQTLVFDKNLYLKSYENRTKEDIGNDENTDPTELTTPSDYIEATIESTVVTDPTEATTGSMVVTDPTEPSTGGEDKPTDSTEPSSGDDTKPSDTTEPSTGDDTKPSEPVVDKGILGDVNGDGKVNIKDATMIQKAAAKIIELTDDEKLRADVNTDNKNNVKDATAIQKFVAKIETGFPIGELIVS